jgi:hypothetical protein
MTDTVSAEEDIDAPQAAVGLPDVLTCVITELTLQGMDNDSSGHNIYHWSTATGQISAGGGTLSPTVTAPGDYMLLVTDTLNGCTAEAIASVYQNIAPPQLSTVDSDTLNCAIKETTLLCLATAASGKNISYQWNTQNGKIVSGADGPEPVVSAAGLYTVTVTDLYNSCTGTAAVAVPVDVQQPPASVAPPGLLTCVVHDVTLDGSGSAQGNRFAYTWSGPSIISGGGTLAPVVNQPGQYFLEVFNLDNSCSSTATALVAQDIQPLYRKPGKRAGKKPPLLILSLLPHRLQGMKDLRGTSIRNSPVPYAWKTGMILYPNSHLPQELPRSVNYTVIPYRLHPLKSDIKTCRFLYRKYSVY